MAAGVTTAVGSSTADLEAAAPSSHPGSGFSVLGAPGVIAFSGFEGASISTETGLAAKAAPAFAGLLQPSRAVPLLPSSRRQRTTFGLRRCIVKQCARPSIQFFH